MTRARNETRARRWLLVALYALFLLVCVEVALQLFYRVTAGDWLFARAGLPVWAPNPYSGVFNKPDLQLLHRTNEFEATYYTDAQGLRVPEAGATVAREKASGVYRVMLLGPSFAFGWGVDYEQTFAARLETLLSAGGFAGEREIEVVNAGVNSLPTAPHLRWYREFGSGYQPDLVILFTYGTMLVDGAQQTQGTVDAAGYLIKPDAGGSRRLKRLGKNLASVFYAWILYTELSGRLDGGEGPREILGAGRELPTAQHFDPERADVAAALAFYAEIDQIVKQSGAEPLIVYFPLSYAIHPEDTSRWRHLGLRDVEGQRAFDAAFCSHLSGAGIACIDLTPSLQQAAGAGNRLYYWLDIHWTPEGNEVAARAVADSLLQRAGRSEAEPSGGRDYGDAGGTPSRQ